MEKKWSLINSDGCVNMEWPSISGRYKVGNAKSPVVVCSMATIDMNLPMDNIALMGKCVTENVGIERIVKNIISNPNIRFLICCGKVSKGHFVGDALECLVKNGVDSQKRIVEAKGAMPVVNNLTKDEIEQFRKQVRVICMQGEMDVDKITEKINECVKNNSGPYHTILPITKTKEKIDVKKIETIEACHDEDRDIKLESCFFEIKLDREKGKIIAECYKYPRELKCVITGRSAEDITHTIIREKLIKDLTHASYLGRELQKAEIALKNDLEYVEQEELKMK